MGVTRFTRPKGGDSGSSQNLYVANCGPAVGLSFDVIASVFGLYGEVKGVYAADESGTRVIVSYHEESSAQSAMKALNGRPCPDLGGRSLHIRYSVESMCPVQVSDSVTVSLEASEVNIPGLHLIPDFVSEDEEKELLAAVDSRPWQCLAKRRVQHYGYEFCYSKLDSAVNTDLDQLTVNEYPPGVGLSPHIDTHSAFEGFIFSLSLAGPCIMEFRKYPKGVWPSDSIANSDNASNFLRRAIYLPPRSMLLLSGEARYAWHHYIPHHKVDMVKDSPIRRGPRRVSFTLRKVRKGPCLCEFPDYCDSRK